MDQYFLGTSVPTEENEAADVSSRTNIAHMVVVVYFFLNLERIYINIDMRAFFTNLLAAAIVVAGCQSSNDIDDVVNDDVEGNIGTVVAYVEGMEDKDPNFLIDVQAIKDFKFDFTVKTETPTYLYAISYFNPTCDVLELESNNKKGAYPYDAVLPLDWLQVLQIDSQTYECSITNVDSAMEFFQSVRGIALLFADVDGNKDPGGIVLQAE